jgi:hypothetical protein
MKNTIKREQILSLLEAMPSVNILREAKRYSIKIFFTIVLLWLFSACNELDVPPVDIIQDKDLFNTESGVAAYMSTLYEYLPIEDFRYSTNQDDGFNNWNILVPLSINTGEQISIRGGLTNPARGYWNNAYTAIRYANYFIQSFPEYAGNFTGNRAVELDAEAHFLRAYIYFALVKRYGGVPIIKTTQSFPEQSLEELQVPRDKEEEVYDFIAEDLDIAINSLPEKSSMTGRTNKYVAAAFKSRVMLFAGSIAKYANVQLDGLVGIPASRANDYFKASYDAAKMLEGKYSLYRKHTDKYTNYVQLFFDETSTENIFVRYYQYPNTGHCYDALFIPFQSTGPQGYSSTYNPTLNYVELFDGLPKDENGHIKVKDDNGNCIFFNSRGELFKDAEPRLRASVMLPDDGFKGKVIDVRRAVYVGPVGNGIAHNEQNLLGKAADMRTGTRSNNPLVNIGGGATLPASGWDGRFQDGSLGTITGFYVRKYQDETRPTELVRLPNYSDQHWIDLRYAEVLLNRAEAAYELYSLGAGGGIDYRADALQCINDIRERGGAVLLAGINELNMQVIRKERRKELAFENKIWWDMRRWRTADTELNNTVWNVLNPYYVVENGKYIFQRRPDERNTRYTFNVNWYYEAIPAGEIGKNPNLLPNNPGY